MDYYKIILMAIIVLQTIFIAVHAYQSFASLKHHSFRLQARAGGKQVGFGESFQGGKNFLDTVFNRLDREKKKEKVKTEEDRMLEHLDTKPWRANKVRHLPITYRPSKESWRERYRDPGDDTIYLYSQPKFKPISATARLDEVWNFPWMWTKTKAERLAWIHKYFYIECERMSVQEHMELDAFFSEFDMPTRWGIIRMKEFDVLNVFFLNLCFWTDFNGIKPTDLGLRPDGTVKTCPVQFHNCISSSNSPSDTDHYAPPFRWDRAKSPEQAYDDIKRVYSDYPKRGLKWSSGWIDRGGWDPQQFGGQYFYAQAHSLAFHYTDDIEMNLDIPNRQVQFRSSTRLGQADWDVERLRYNQFVRMLDKKGGWEVAELPRLNWYTRTPFRWTELLIDKSSSAIERAANQASMLVPSIAASGDSDGAARRALNELKDVIQPALRPLLDAMGKLRDDVILEPRVAATLQALEDFEAAVEADVDITSQEVRRWVETVIRVIPDRFLPVVEQESQNQLPEDPGTIDSPSGLSDAGPMKEDKPSESQPWLFKTDENGAKEFTDFETIPVEDTLGSTMVEDIVEASSPLKLKSQIARTDSISKGEKRIRKAQLRYMQENMRSLGM